MSGIPLCRHTTILRPNSARVIIRSFIPDCHKRIVTIIGRTLALTEVEVAQELQRVRDEFSTRHLDMEAPLLAHFAIVEKHVFTQRPLSKARQLLIGAQFSGEYALESAALFNPSIVPHPDQREIPDGSLRFIMSLRATGEGHISSVEFREGTVSNDGAVQFTAVTPHVATPVVVSNPTYQKKRFLIKLHEMGFDNECTATLMEPLGGKFSRADLAQQADRFRRDNIPMAKEVRHTLDCVQWLADSNYELQFPSHMALSERVIFPVSTNESNGIEDARFVRFTADDGTVTYYATYTAYSGESILPQLIETEDFLHFRVLTLNGAAVQNKGMALFPRQIDGRYAMLSRQDDENLFIMFSDNPHYWSNPQIVLRPAETWESVKIGNCGSPIETDAGWLVITHGVGPMRKYCIGAALLDLHDPTQVIGRLREPLLSAEGYEREGYVPNVVYSCGALIHGEDLILPYAMSDQATAVVTVPVKDLLAAMTT